MNQQEIQKLRELAQKAPQERWKMIQSGSNAGLRVASGFQGFFNLNRPNKYCTDEVNATVDFIEAMSPPAALELIAMAESTLAAPAESVDTPEFTGRLMCCIVAPDDALGAEIAGLIAHVNAWGATRREAGQQEGKERIDCLRVTNEQLRERIEELEMQLAARPAVEWSDEQIRMLAIEHGVIAFHEDPKLMAFARALLAQDKPAAPSAPQQHAQTVLSDGEIYETVSRKHAPELAAAVDAQLSALAGDDLPPLPKPLTIRGGPDFQVIYAIGYTADMMQAYAREAVAADRAGRGDIFDEQWFEFTAARLRTILTRFGLSDPFPDDDKALCGVLGTVLANVRLHFDFPFTAPVGDGDERVLYTCIGKGGEYELIGTAKGAGVLRALDDVRVYRGENGRLFYRTTDDFDARMKRIDRAANGAGDLKGGVA